MEPRTALSPHPSGAVPAGSGPRSPWPFGSEQRRIARLCLSALAVLSGFSMLGVAFSLYLVNHQPLLLIALSPLGRHLFLVAPFVDPVAFVVVAAVRRMLFFTASYELGRALGPDGIVWVEARAARFGRFVRWLERLFARASQPVVLCMAGPTVSALAGVSGMSRRAFFTLATTGLVLRMLVLIVFAEALRGYIEIALEWIEAVWIPGTVVMVALVSAYQWRVRGRRF